MLSSVAFFLKRAAVSITMSPPSRVCRFHFRNLIEKVPPEMVIRFICSTAT
ncbi:hypothetical protein 1013_scaffold1563_00004 [Bacteriophage sp.]|nr:hypothetical protein 1013_scaffold1563_00004 [Bacteriophage sp.]